MIIQCNAQTHTLGVGEGLENRLVVCIVDDILRSYVTSQILNEPTKFCTTWCVGWKKTVVDTLTRTECQSFYSFAKLGDIAARE